MGAKHSSLLTVDRRDGSVSYSDTAEATLTYCLNGTFANLQSATCSAGGLNATTQVRKDAFGRTTAVTEPTGDVTTYAYDVNSRLTRVTQGAQSRTYNFDAAGMLRDETTPEGGRVTHDAIGTLGNVLRETRPGGLVLTRQFDFAGRVTREDAGGSKYAVHCYDGSGDLRRRLAQLSRAERAPPGKLTRRYGYNFLPTVGPVVDEIVRVQRRRRPALEADDGRGQRRPLHVRLADLGLRRARPALLALASPGCRARLAFPVTVGYVYGLPTSIARERPDDRARGGLRTVRGPLVLDGRQFRHARRHDDLSRREHSCRGRPASRTLSGARAPTRTTASATSSGSGTSDTFTYDSRARLTSARFGSVTRGFAYDRWGNLTRTARPPSPSIPSGIASPRAAPSTTRGAT